MRKITSSGNFLLKLLYAKIPLTMKLITLILIVTALNVSARVYSQYAKITVNINNGTLEDVFKAIEKQTDFNIFYNVEQVNLKQKVSVDAKEELVSEVLDKVLTDAGVSYTVLDKTIVIKEKKEMNMLVTKITGVVKSSDDGQPLIGATVFVKGTKTAAITDIDGKFEISVEKADSELVVSYVGYTTQNIALNGKTSVEIILSPELHALDEVVVIGYGTIKKKDLTGAVAVVKADDIKSEGSNTAVKALQGKMAGVEIESSGGSPGSRNRVLIRGISSTNDAVDPLYIVDGVPVDNIDNLLPTDIESVTVLKDASAAAIYGTRASTGVVLVTTKMGKKGENKIEFNMSYGWQQIIKKMNVCNSQEWAKIDNAAHLNDTTNKKPLPRIDIADTLPEDANGNIINTDWQNEIYHIAPVQSYELSSSGGGDNYTYGISGGYFGQQGIIKETSYDRLNLRIKSDFHKGRFRIGETVMLSDEHWRTMPDGWGGQGGGPAAAATKMIPAFPVYSDTSTSPRTRYAGTYGALMNVANPVAQLYLEEPKDQYFKVFANVFAELELLKGLKYKYNVGYNTTFRYQSDYTYDYKLGDFFTSQTSLSETREENNYFLQEHTLSYVKSLGKLDINALAGFTLEQNKWRGMTAKGQSLPNSLEVLNVATIGLNANGTEYDNASESYIGRIILSYDEKYLLTGTFRRDGSSKFGAVNRFGNFPSIGLGWNISHENFFEGARNVINDLKLRASYGSLGNSRIADYQYVTGVTTNDNYVIGSDQHKWIGTIQSTYASKGIKWESCITKNIGLDIGLLKNQLTVTTDYFIKVNGDVLIKNPLPPSTGAQASDAPPTNIGQITNKGIEFAVNYKNNVGNLLYNITGTFTKVNNKVDNLGYEGQQLNSGYATHHGGTTTVTMAGYEVASFYLIKTQGIFNSWDEIYNYTAVDSVGNPILTAAGIPKLIQPLAKPGDVKFVDANHDGKINASDRIVMGSAQPKFEYSFNINLSWKGIDLTMYMQGTQGGKLYNGLRQDLLNTSTQWNYSKDALNFWTPENHSNIPRPTTKDQNINNTESDRYLEDGSYLRFKTLQVGYTIPKSITNKIKIDRIRIYGSVDNLYTFTKYKGFNPDLGRHENAWQSDLLSRGVDYGHIAYPLPRTWLVGIQVSL